jgi:hypothetical protein
MKAPFEYCLWVANARAGAKVHRLERLIRRGVALCDPVRRPPMDKAPKRQEPEITPPRPRVEPGRSVPEIPPDQDVPEKTTPVQGRLEELPL